MKSIVKYKPVGVIKYPIIMQHNYYNGTIVLFINKNTGIMLYNVCNVGIGEYKTFKPSCEALGTWSIFNGIVELKNDSNKRFYPILVQSCDTDEIVLFTGIETGTVVQDGKNLKVGHFCLMWCECTNPLYWKDYDKVLKLRNKS